MLDIKLHLAGSKPEIYRLIRINNSLNLQLIHEVIQAAFSWNNMHTHLFRTPDNAIIKNEEEMSIIEAFRKWERLIYIYDLADYWTVEITLQNKSSEFSKKKPVCLEGQGKSPPEDSGGIINYCEVIELYSNHKTGKRQYPLIAEWLGDDFDPLNFDCNEVNQNLKNLVI